jgi:hypothetical protein
VDYLRVIEEELDQHAEFIRRGLKRYKDNASILAKYKWLREYHRYTVEKWNERNHPKS